MKSYWWTELKKEPPHRPASVFGIKKNKNIQALNLKNNVKKWNIKQSISVCKPLFPTKMAIK